MLNVFVARSDVRHEHYQDSATSREDVEYARSKVCYAVVDPGCAVLPPIRFPEGEHRCYTSYTHCLMAPAGFHLNTKLPVHKTFIYSLFLSRRVPPSTRSCNGPTECTRSLNVPTLTANKSSKHMCTRHSLPFDCPPHSPKAYSYVSHVIFESGPLHAPPPDPSQLLSLNVARRRKLCDEVQGGVEWWVSLAFVWRSGWLIRSCSKLRRQF